MKESYVCRCFMKYWKMYSTPVLFQMDISHNPSRLGNGVMRFFISCFFHQIISPGMPRNDFKFFWIFVELFIFVIDSPVMITPWSRLESLKLGNFCQHKSHVPRYSSSSNQQSIFRMTDPLKIVVCFLKSVKQLPGVQNNFPVMNTPRRSWLPSGEYTRESWLSSDE